MRTLSAPPLALLLFLASGVLASGASGQTPDPAVPRLPQPDAPAPEASGEAVPAGAVRLSLDEAIQIALERNYSIRLAEFDVENARAPGQRGLRGLFPRADAASSVHAQRGRRPTPSPGSSAGSLFAGLGAIGWLQFNELARTDDDPTTVPISLEAVQRARPRGPGRDRVQSCQRGPTRSGRTTVHQLALDLPAALQRDGVRGRQGGQGLVEINQAAVAQTRGRDDPPDAAGVLRARSWRRSRRASCSRAARRVARTPSPSPRCSWPQGVRPLLDRLNAEVDLANAETQLVQSACAAPSRRRDQLLLTLGLPVGRRSCWKARCAPTEPICSRRSRPGRAGGQPSTQRPDLEQARLAIRAQRGPAQHHAGGRLPQPERLRQRPLQRQHPGRPLASSPRPTRPTRSPSRPATTRVLFGRPTGSPP